MEASSKLSRRAFLQTAIAAAAAAGLACDANGTPWRFFTVDEARTLSAICDQIIPPDADHGAAWAGVVTYIDRQLCGPFQNLQSSYRIGIAGVDQSCRALDGGRSGKDFAALDGQKQADLLHALEENRAPGAIWKERSSSDFFSMVIDHTMQGFYGDPRHGGNRDGVSWKMLGLPYPPIRGRLRKS